MERLVRNAIVEHMTVNNLFSDCQHGFIKGKSCITQLLEFLEDITVSLDNGKDVDAIYFDYCKAFDKIPHKRLIKKLENYGRTKQSLKWINDFLSNRRQRVVIKGSYSSWTEITSGVPQGSILGPVLFLAFINELPEVIKGLMKIFVDDIKFYYPIESPETLKLLQDDVGRLETSAHIWKMLYNNKKCHHVRIGENSGTNNYEMDSGENKTQIERVKSEKIDLGIIIDEKLKFREHKTQKVNKANRNLGIIFRTFSCMDKDMFLNLYKSIVHPFVEYATHIWYPQYKKKNKDKIMLENVQRRAMRLMKCLKYLSYPERLKALGLPTQEYRREWADMVQVYKIPHNIDIVNKEKLFKLVPYTSTKGHPFKLFKTRTRLNVRSKFFTQLVVDQWN